MGSSANKVLAIPELLEHVLLCLEDDQNSLYGSVSHNLFTLLRVNRTFNATIRSSSKLSRRMGTIHYLNADWPYAATKELKNLSWFKQAASPLGRFKEPVLKRDAMGLNLFFVSLVGRGGHASAARHCELRVGLLGSNDQVYHQEYHSWRAMKLSAATEQTNVFVQVSVERSKLSRFQRSWLHFLIRSFLAYDLPGCFIYTVGFHFANGEGTLGKLVDIMKGIMLEYELVHITRAALRDRQMRRGPARLAQWWFETDWNSGISVLAFIACCNAALALLGFALVWVLLDILGALANVFPDALTMAGMMATALGPVVIFVLCTYRQSTRR